jgi:hypothetical protein
MASRLHGGPRAQKGATTGPNAQRASASRPVIGIRLRRLRPELRNTSCVQRKAAATSVSLYTVSRTPPDLNWVCVGLMR